jgi:hypothetical protein
LLFSFYYIFRFASKRKELFLAKVFAKFGISAEVQWWGVLGTYISTSQERERGRRVGGETDGEKGLKWRVRETGKERRRDK